MVLIPIILQLNRMCLEALFLVLSYSLFTSMIWEEIYNPMTNFLLFFIIIVKNPKISANYLNQDLDVIRGRPERLRVTTRLLKDKLPRHRRHVSINGHETITFVDNYQ